jgi:hypothetical protein
MLKLAQHPLFLARVEPHKAVITRCLKDPATARRRTAFQAMDRPQQQAAKGRANCLTSDTFSFFPVHDVPGGLVCKKKTAQKPALSGTFGPLLPNSARCFSAGMKAFLSPVTGIGKPGGPETTDHLTVYVKKHFGTSDLDLCTEIVRPRGRALTEVH